MKIKKRPYTTYLCLFLIILLSGMKGFPGFAQSLEKDQINLNKARELRKTREFDRAISLLNNILQTQPRNSIIYYERGINYFELKRYEKASEDFNQSINFDPELLINPKPDMDRIFYYRGIVNYEWALSQDLSRENFNEKIKSSIEDIERSIQIDPTRLTDLLREYRRKPEFLDSFDASYDFAVEKCSGLRRDCQSLTDLITQLPKIGSNTYSKYKTAIDTRVQKGTKVITKYRPEDKKRSHTPHQYLLESESTKSP
jgi:tetratricopeptide (TPR) repeat protein